MPKLVENATPEGSSEGVTEPPTFGENSFEEKTPALADAPIADAEVSTKRSSANEPSNEESAKKRVKKTSPNGRIEKVAAAAQPSSPVEKPVSDRDTALDAVMGPLIADKEASTKRLSEIEPLNEESAKKRVKKMIRNESTEGVSAATKPLSPVENPVLDMELALDGDVDSPIADAEASTSASSTDAPQVDLHLDQLAPPVAVHRPSVLQHPSKRAYEFRCKFSQIVAFKNFFENLGSVLHEVTLEVRNDPDGFKGIVADSMDARGVALVHGKLAGQVELNVPQATFCITVKDILDLFPNVHPQHFIEIYRLEGTTDITLYVYEPSIRTTTPSIQIKTLARSIETLEIQEMEYSYYVEIELAAFRNALKTAKSQKATSIQLCVYEIPRSQGGEKTIFFVVKYTGERTSSSFPYESRIITTGADKGPITIKALEGGGGSDSGEEEEGLSMQEKLEEMEPSYQGTFLAEYLYLFVKSMDRFNITLRLGHGRPLIVDYPLGCSSTDGLRYVLAPTCSLD